MFLIDNFLILTGQYYQIKATLLVYEKGVLIMLFIIMYFKKYSPSSFKLKLLTYF